MDLDFSMDKSEISKNPRKQINKSEWDLKEIKRVKEGLDNARRKKIYNNENKSIRY